MPVLHNESNTLLSAASESSESEVSLDVSILIVVVVIRTRLSIQQQFPHCRNLAVEHLCQRLEVAESLGQRLESGNSLHHGLFCVVAIDENRVGVLMQVDLHQPMGAAAALRH
jgi:hypothetical protein